MDKSQIQSGALTAIGDKRRAGVAGGTGSGKTLIGIRHMNLHYTDHCRFLIVGSKKSIYTTWKEEMEKFGMMHLCAHVKFTTYRSLTKQDLDYDVVYLDECHNLKFSHDPWLCKFPGKILGLTGTPPINMLSERGKMVARYCPIVFTYKVDDAISDGILNDYKIIVHMLSLDTNKTLKMLKKDGTVWYTSELASYNFWTAAIEHAAPSKAQMARIMRMKTMQTFPSKEKLAEQILWKITDKCLVFGNTKEQADRLCEHSYYSGNIQSDNNLKLFKQGAIMRLSAVLQLSEGINIPDLKEGIIMHAFGNERGASQKIGRFLRLNPKDESVVHILCYRNTVDEEWVKLALADFDQTKITYV